MRLLALGDSYTCGEAVAPEERWTAHLERLLAARNVALATTTIATTGWTTDELDAAIDEAQPPAGFDVVTLLVGVNNQYRGRPAGEFRREFAALLDRAVGFAGGDPGRTIALSIPDWGITPFAEGRDRAAIAAEIEAFNSIVREEAAARRALHADVAGRWRRAARERSLIAADGLHPSGAMYADWASLLLPLFLELAGRGERP